MSDDDFEMSEITARRAEEAADWDEHKHKPHARDVVGLDPQSGEVTVGEVIEEVVDSEYQLDPRVGPLQFKGKEDYIRGETACLRGMDIVGLVPQKGSTLGKKMTVQNQGAGFTAKTMKTATGPRTFLKLTVKPASVMKAAAHKDSIAAARLVAKHAKMVASTGKSFKSKPPAKRVIGGFGSEWDDIVGDGHFYEITGSAEWNSIIGGFGSEWDDIVGVDPRVAFDDVLGAPVRRAVMGRRKLPPDAIVRKLSSELATVASKLGRSADKHESNVKKATDKLQAGIKAVQKSYGKSGSKGSRIIGSDRPSRGPNLLDVIPFDSTIDELMGDDAPPPSDYSPTEGYTGEADLPPGPDENYGVGPQPTMESDGVRMDANIDYDTDPSPDGGSWMHNWDSGGDVAKLPKGAIVYDKTMPFAISGVGSRTRFFGGAPGDFGADDSGFEFGNYTDAPNGHADGWYWFWAAAYYDKVANDQRYKRDEPKHPTGADKPPYFDGQKYDWNNDPMRARAEASMHCGWGPLIGNPKQMSPADAGMKSSPVPLYFWGLKYDIGADVFFWYWEQAPDWARAPILAQRLGKALLDYDTQVTNAKTDYLAAVQLAKKNKAEADEQARQWGLEQARMQHDQEKADAAQAIQQQQFDEQQYEQQTQMDMEHQKNQDQLDFQQQSAYNQWLATPEGQASFAQQGGGGDGGPFDDVQDQGSGFGGNEAEAEAFSADLDASEGSADWE